jgi:putative alpha-1,2-mannosidase
MYSALGKPESAAQKIKIVTDSLYKLGPDGLSGNDDCGQMSAWLIWTMLGMYPMNPASGEYVFGYPLVNSASIQLPTGKNLSIKVNKIKSSTKPAQIYSATLNGQKIWGASIKHEALLKGGTLVFDIIE